MIDFINKHNSGHQVSVHFILPTYCLFALYILQGSSRDKCYKFLLDGYFVGFIHPMFLDWLLKYANVFVKISHPQHGDHCITMHQAMINVNDRSNAVAEVMQDLRTTSPFKALKGWRNEVSYLFQMLLLLFFNFIGLRYLRKIEQIFQNNYSLR